MLPFNGWKNLQKKETPIPWGLRLPSNQWQKKHKGEWEITSFWINTLFHSMAKRTWRRKLNQFLKDKDLLPINDKGNVKENEKPIPYGLIHDSIQWPKEHKEERVTNSWRTKTCFHSMAEKNLKKTERLIPCGLRLASNQWQKKLKGEWETTSFWINTWFHSMAKRIWRRKRNQFLKD